MSDAVRDVIVGATTALAVFGAFLAFGICLIAAVMQVFEERKREKEEAGNG